MAFVQTLLTGIQTGAPLSTDLYLNDTSATVTGGNAIVVMLGRWGTFSLGQPWTVTDNLGNTYNTASVTYTGSVHAGIFYATNISGGTLNSIRVQFGGVGNVSYHITGCSAEFSDSLSSSSMATTLQDTAQTSNSTSALTLSTALQLYGVAIGGNSENGGGTNFVPPSGFTVAHSKLTTSTAASSFLCYKYGSVGASEVLTSSWDESRKSRSVHGKGGDWTPPFSPGIYRRVLI